MWNPTPKYQQLVCRKVCGGKRPLWQAEFRHKPENIPTIVGAGNTADNAIKDYQRQWRWLASHS